MQQWDVPTLILMVKLGVLDVIPTEVKDELDNMSEYYKNIILIFLGDYVELEKKKKENCC